MNYVPVTHPGAFGAHNLPALPGERAPTNVTPATVQHCARAGASVADQVANAALQGMGIVETVSGILGCLLMGARLLGGARVDSPMQTVYQVPPARPAPPPPPTPSTTMDMLRAHATPPGYRPPPPPPAGYGQSLI